jgi:hypothetical protein
MPILVVFAQRLPERALEYQSETEPRGLFAVDIDPLAHSERE